MSDGFLLEMRDLRGAPALMLIDHAFPNFDPLVVDFLSGRMQHRLKNGLNKNQPLAKALGLKSFRAGSGPRVIDATAGMGTDAFVMAAMGCRVRAFERSPHVFQLLVDGLRRLREASAGNGVDSAIRTNVNLGEICARLSFENLVSHEILAAQADALALPGDAAFFSSTDRPEIVYLDPMYPDEGRSKSALPKKEMQIFRRLLGDDLDAEALLELARKCARERVVVKRPLYAATLGGSCTHSFEGKTARFDTYLTKI